MAYRATVLEIMIACPQDVKDERNIVRDVIKQWNAENARERGVVLLPLSWDTHTGSDIQGRHPQSIINKRLVDRADIMVGIFWNTVGGGGAVQEIKRQHGRGKAPLMLFFSDVPEKRERINFEEGKKIDELVKWAQTRGLYTRYDDRDVFAGIFRQDLTHLLRENAQLQALIAAQAEAGKAAAVSSDVQNLIAAANGDRDLELTVKMGGDGGWEIHTAGQCFGSLTDRRSALRWRGVLQDAQSLGLVEDITKRAELYRLTSKALRS